MIHRLVFAIIFILATPAITHAAVVINEIAWMGTTVGPNEEWIELHNNGGSAVSLDGWTLSDGVSLDIPLTGTVGAGEYAVLERTDDDTVAGTAFLIYTGALANDGRTLTLRRSDGGVEDQVGGGANWVNVGGDNVTKNTAQRASTGWVTSTPTPGSINTNVNTTNEEENNPPEENVVVKTVSKTNSSGEKITLVPSKNELALTLVAPTIAYVNQQVSFRVQPSGIGETLMNSLTYQWSFGDTYSATGTDVSHSFGYPGEYVVAVEGFYARHRAVVLHTLTVLPVAFTISRADGGDIQIHNTAKYEIDLSGFRLKGDTELVMPQHTILLPNSTITIAPNRLETGSQKMIALYDTRGTVVASDMPEVFLQQNASNIQNALAYVPSVPVQKKSVSNSTGESVFKETTTSLGTATIERIQETIIPIGNTQGAQVISGDAQSEFAKKLPYVGLVSVVLIAILFLYMRRDESDSVSVK